jgi:FkbM family methyltransferase
MNQKTIVMAFGKAIKPNIVCISVSLFCLVFVVSLFKYDPGLLPLDTAYHHNALDKELLNRLPWPPRNERSIRSLHFPLAEKSVNVYSTDFTGTLLRPDWWIEVESKKWEVTIFKIIKTVQRKYPGLHVDSGSWIGPTALFASLYAPNVLLIEPDPWAFDEAVNNFMLNPTLNDKATILRYCISTKDETLEFYGLGISGSTTSNARYKDQKPWSVECKSLSKIMKSYFAKHWNLKWTFWKLDVEGAESFLFPASIPVLKQYNWPIVHLSLHPFFWPEQEKSKIAKSLLIAMKNYKFIYNSELTQVELTESIVDGSAKLGTDFLLSMHPIEFESE